jgi:hypothetical protein
VNGTIQKEHILLHPLMMETKADGLSFDILTGEISAYVSSKDNYTLIYDYFSSGFFNKFLFNCLLIVLKLIFDNLYIMSTSVFLKFIRINNLKILHGLLILT